MLKKHPKQITTWEVGGSKLQSLCGHKTGWCKLNLNSRAMHVQMYKCEEVLDNVEQCLLLQFYVSPSVTTCALCHTLCTYVCLSLMYKYSTYIRIHTRICIHSIGVPVFWCTITHSCLLFIPTCVCFRCSCCQFLSIHLAGCTSVCLSVYLFVSLWNVCYTYRAGNLMLWYWNARN